MNNNNSKKRKYSSVFIPLEHEINLYHECEIEDCKKNENSPQADFETCSYFDSVIAERRLLKIGISMEMINLTKEFPEIIKLFSSLEGLKLVNTYSLVTGDPDKAFFYLIQLNYRDYDFFNQLIKDPHYCSNIDMLLNSAKDVESTLPTINLNESNDLSTLNVDMAEYYQ